MERPWFQFYEKGVPRTLQYPAISLISMFSQTASTYPNHTATNFVLQYMAGSLITIGGKLSYRKLEEYIDRFATALYQLGVRKGDRIGLMLPNSPHFLISFFAAMRLGAIVVPINPTYTGRELKYQLQDSEAETIVLLNLFWPRLREVQSSTAVRRVIVAHIFDTLPWQVRLLVRSKQRRSNDWVDVKPEHDIFFFDHLLQKYGPLPPRIPSNSDDIALFQYTGGTTGKPKAAMLTHGNMIANTIQVTSWLADGQPGQEKMMAAIPFFHSYGLTVSMLLAVGLASEMVIVPNPRLIEHVMQVISRERCTLFPGVPALYISMINHPHVHRYNLRSVRACISGSAHLPMDVQERFGELTGGRLVEGYGLTEAAPVTHCNPLYGQRKAGCIGIPLPDVDAKLIDLEHGTDLPLESNEPGELCVRGPQVMRGYWNRTEETNQALQDGWLRTGDICHIDRDGFFKIVDRKKDMIVVGGFKVLPHEVEEVLFMHPDIMEVVVVGIPNPERGDETVKAYMVLQSGSTAPTVQEIRAFCALHLAPYKIPREIEYRNSLPRTVIGKVLRRVLVEEALQRMHSTDEEGTGSGMGVRQQPAST
ncbi:MAG: long-chain fatty acid--CoA ligase [Chloroflexaceae bacterium]|nr:long-chain fatty acid--CoA ligase [Chloroflexaceae bacterium]